MFVQRRAAPRLLWDLRSHGSETQMTSESLNAFSNAHCVCHVWRGKITIYCIMGCTGRTLATYRLCRRASWERIKVDSVSGVPAKCVHDWSAVINHEILETPNKVRAVSACGATGHVHDSVWSSEIEFGEYSWSLNDTFNNKDSLISINTLL